MLPLTRGQIIFGPGGQNVNFMAKNTHGPDVYHSGPHFAYFGSFAGELISRSHGVAADVYVADEVTIILRQFNYNGGGPDPIFWAGPSNLVNQMGFQLQDARGRGIQPFSGRFVDQDVVLKLPSGRTVREIRWFSVYCQDSNKSYGDVQFPPDIAIPSALDIGPLMEPRGRHGVSTGSITVADTQTLLVTLNNYFKNLL